MTYQSYNVKVIFTLLMRIQPSLSTSLPSRQRQKRISKNLWNRLSAKLFLMVSENSQRSSLNSRYLKEAKEISVPDEPLKLGKFFFGRQEVLSEGGFKYEASSIAVAKFIMYSQKPNCYIVKIPKDKVSLKKAVAEYEKYIEGLKDNLFEEFVTRTHDHKLADMLVARVIEEAGVRE